MAEDRNLLERAQDYLVSGDFDRDARYVLGPHLSKGLLGLAQLIGPGADIKAGIDEAKRIVPSLREGNVPGALAATGLAAATPLFMVSPGSAKEVREVSEKLIPQRLFHGTSNPDIKKLKSSKEGVLGEGVYLTPDPKYASTYATGDTANVIPVTANIKNPLVVQSTGAEPSTDVLKALGVPEDKAFSITEKAFDDKGNITKEISTRARKQGYDAVVFKNKDGDIQEIVAYKPDNISSAIGKKAEEATPENIPVMPVNQAKLEEKGFDFKPGGEYVNPKTNEILTGRNVGSASISITSEGKPKFDVTPIEKEIVGSPSDKGATQIKTNLFKKSAGWKWIDGPKKYKDIPTLVSVQNKGKHYYTLETNFPEGVNLTRYPDSPSEPRLRPTVKGFVNLGKKIGTISVRGKKHPVYDKIINKYAGGQIKKGGSVVERNPNNYSPKAI